MSSSSRSGPPLAGRRALVTGAGSAEGIGFAIARALARDGAAVAITATTERIHARAAELSAEGARVYAHVADLTDRAAVGALAGAAARELGGPLQILVNNAGMAQSGAPLPDAPVGRLDGADWDRQLAISLTSAFNVVSALARGLLAGGWGRIVNVSSTTGPISSYPGQAAYAAAKAGLDGLTRTLAIELGPHGITANSIAPGWIATASSTEQERAAALHTPARRAGTPAEVAAVAAFLAGPGASYVNGHTLVVDGGNCVLEDRSPPP